MNSTRIIHILQFLIDAAARGERTALVTITDVIGGSSRAPGTHLAVSETGAFRGSLSGGCVEAAVVGEAQRVIASRTAEVMRIGRGSPLIDIRLPCGGGMDLLFTPAPPASVLSQAVDALQARRPVTLFLGRDGSIEIGAGPVTGVSGWNGHMFEVLHEPALKLWILGHGAEVEALVRLTQAYGADTEVLSPDADIAEAVGGRLLKTPSLPGDMCADAYSAVVLLFHDHDWEAPLLTQILVQQPFYIGAMGSALTHRRRCEALTAMGVAPEQLQRISGPVGLIPATRDPDTLALSILAEIVQRRSRRIPGA